MNVAERKIQSALNKAAELHRNGEEPNEACIKAASINELNPDMTKRLVEGFNIGMTNAKIAKASDKTISFPIADIDTVIPGVFVDKEKVANEKVAAMLTEEYSETLQDFTFSLTDGQKVASTLDDLPHLMRQMDAHCKARKDELSKVAQDIIHGEHRMESALGALVEHFSYVDNRGKFASFEGDVLSEYGDACKGTLDVIFEISKLDEARCDQNVKIGSINIHRGTEHDLFDKLMAASNDYINACTTHGTKLAEFQAEKQAFDESIREIRNEPAPAPPSAADAITGSFSKGAATPGSKGGLAGRALEGTFGGVDTLAQGLSGGIENLDRYLVEEGPYSSAQSKALELEARGPQERANAEIANVKRQAILMDLMRNDEIISKQEPKQIQSVYNTLLGISPELTLHPEVVRSFLRSSSSQQSVDPFTVEQLAKTQGQILKNKAPKPEDKDK